MPAGTPVELGHITDSALDPVVVTLGAGASVGDLVLVIAHNLGVVYSACTDSRGNTYNRPINDAGGSFCGLMMAWSVITTALQAGDTVTVTTGFTGMHQHVQVLRVTGIAASPLDQFSLHVDGAGSTSFTSNNTPTTTQADDFLIAATTANVAATTVTPAGGWNASPTTPSFTGGVSGHRDYQNVAATGAYAYTGTFANNTLSTTGIIAFKAAPSGPSPSLLPATPVVI